MMMIHACTRKAGRLAANSVNGTVHSTRLRAIPNYSFLGSRLPPSFSSGAAAPEEVEANSPLVQATKSGGNSSVSRSIKYNPLYPLIPLQQKMAKWLPVINSVCSISAKLLGRPDRRLLDPRDNTRRCYEDFFDPLCADTGLWPDYTEGYYPNGNESYEEAKLKQFDFILDKTESTEGTRIFELGCGNGYFLKRAKSRGCQEYGITISRTQAEYCQSKVGVQAEVMNFLDVKANSSSDSLSCQPNSYDVVVMNGSSEHFVTEQDYLCGRKKEIHNEMFDIASYLLKPGGRLFITSIHLNRKSDIHEVIKPAIQHPVGSYYFHLSILLALFSGSYPDVGDYERAAAHAGLYKTFERDATKDFFATSRIWSRRLRAFLRDNKNREFRNNFFSGLFLKDPRYFFDVFLFLLYDSWTWQFRPAAISDGGGAVAEAEMAPMQHRWLMFEKR